MTAASIATALHAVLASGGSAGHASEPTRLALVFGATGGFGGETAALPPSSPAAAAPARGLTPASAHA